MNSEYTTCTRCVMDSTAKDIVFDKEGICNYCTGFLEWSSHIIFQNPETLNKKLDEFVCQIKSDGLGKRYDCIVGVSGGVDSSWALYKAVQLGLRPLAVHMDNGWNSELAQSNIANLVRGLSVDLFTYVIDWTEYRKLMQAFFDADVIDIELLYDNAMLAVVYSQAAKHGVNYILAGTNRATEGMRMPPNWNWFKMDKRNIKAIARVHQGMKLKSFPAIGTIDYIRYHFVSKNRWISFLNYLNYNKSEAMEHLQLEFGYKPYPYKHYESVFTRFYQGYILPEKFGIDKRKLHLSSLIMSGQMKREDALLSIAEIPYPSVEDLEQDKTYFLKKMGWTKEQLEDYLKKPERAHSLYPSEKGLYDFCFRTYQKVMKKK